MHCIQQHCIALQELGIQAESDLCIALHCIALGIALQEFGIQAESDPPSVKCRSPQWRATPRNTIEDQALYKMTVYSYLYICIYTCIFIIFILVCAFVIKRELMLTQMASNTAKQN